MYNTTREFSSSDSPAAQQRLVGQYLGNRQAAANALKHHISFDSARTIFNDPFLFTVADLEHSETEERWFSIGRAVNGSLLSVAYLWSEVEAATKIRVISTRKATQTEIRQYEESL